MTVSGVTLQEGEKLTAKPIPGDPGLPLVGYTFHSMANPIKFSRKRFDQLGEISWCNLFGTRMVSMLGPDANQFVFQNRGDMFSNNQGWDFFIGKFFHRGIMLLDFEEHRHHRRIMQNAFKKPVLVQYLGEMQRPIEQGIQRWLPQDDFHVFTAIKKLTLDMATEIFMGEKLGPEASALNKAFIDTVRAGTALVRYPVPGGRWKKGLDGRKLLYRYFKSRIAEKRAANGSDLFSQLCRAETEEGQKFSDDDVINHMIFLMMAAHDTSTITLCTMLYHLAKNPEWQDQLREESRQLGRSHLEFDDLEKLTGMTLVMKESLRLCSPVPSIPRRTVKDVVYKDVLIPKGSLVSVSPYFTHYMPEYWKNPTEFDPGRFSDERREDKIHPYAWVPFGGGAHMCIGLHFAEVQVKAILHQILLRFKWSVEPGYQMPIDMTSLPVPGDKLPVKLEFI
ncbi:MAG: cytochrome P450 [Pseudomonadales bacterium]|uniref:cytochrome P450 n=1 Tax=unclassified Ketobacter TaxID=2639109 RepID=UPI000C61EA97|nr:MULTISPECIES: cytochrome P450 [unclassified Ketobacter]MAQ25809.1 cytochrome P450 [Pseudomonadales bacterium]MEC8810970.1 cytochrome P450 [Pseudomonadota bacterium]TNC89006.1 MAG: cytochrome P450 [Alcanivorax sp.]HAG93876.1 cytochrome P450 [Gammaproteobacteria bacterium]MBI28088.1 cytochrome P450 [Pseudomonadales bacterium]